MRKAVYEALETLIAREVGRPIRSLAALCRGDLRAAAESLARHPSPVVAVLTGFYVPGAAPPAAETDGPVGAAQLVAALAEVGLGARLVTDEFSVPVVHAAAGAVGASRVPVDLVEPDGGNLDAIRAAWELEAVSHIVAIERLGPSADGTYRNMRGVDVGAWTAPVDRLFTPPRVRTGIGDGGNELGMGKLPREAVAAVLEHGERIACRVGCDHLLVCGISNWGALALIAALAAARPDWRDTLLARLDPEFDARVLRAAVEQGGAVDGVLGRPSFSVDGVGADEHAEVVRRMGEIIGAADQSS